MTEQMFTKADIEGVVSHANGLIAEFQEQRNTALNQVAETVALLRRERAEAQKLRDQIAALTKPAAAAAT